MKSLATLLILAVVFAPTLQAQTDRSDLQRRALRVSVPADRAIKVASATNSERPAWAEKVDPALLTLHANPARTARVAAEARLDEEPVALHHVGGQVLVDLLIQTSAPDALAAVPGVELRTVAGDVAVVRADLRAVPELAGLARVRYVEAARMRRTTAEPVMTAPFEFVGRNDEGRADIRADVVQSGGGGLPRAFRGEGVVVGVLDSGLDITHPDFQTSGGTRVHFLLEYLAGGGERSWTRAQINAGGVTQRDGDGGGGHGTHVTGSATGNGSLVNAQRGVAPAADIVFVKGVRDANSNGGFSDADVIDGVSRTFQQAAALGQPAVVNLSLGGHFSPHDGSSLYEQALSNLTGPGKVIVAAAGNEGSDFIHAGETVAANVLNETIWLVESKEYAGATMWYDANSQNAFSVGAYLLNGSNLEWLGSVGVQAGQRHAEANGDPIPFIVEGTTLGYVRIDAQTTADARNGDGNVTFEVFGDNTVDISQTVWSILSNGGAGRVDTWAVTGGEFYAQEIGFPDQNEIPGDQAMTVGTPSTAQGVVAVGSHVTSATWTDIDGVSRTWQNPGANGPVVPTVGQQSYFSSRGPTRDGRRSPDVTAPGELIFSPLSSHLTEGVGVQRGLILQGGGYAGQQGTSMASPHVAGTVALMLQADPQLGPAAVRQILQETARTDGFTGSVPNDNFGSGKIDALAAVLRTLELCGTRCEGGNNTGGTNLTETEPNNAAAQAQPFTGSFPFTLTANAEGADQGDISITFTNGSSDDLEDLFRVTTTVQGLTLTLSDYTSDLDLYLLDGAATTLLGQSNSVNATETIDLPQLAAGEYLVGVSFYDAGGETGATPYTLRAASGVAVASEDDSDARDVVLYPVAPNPVWGHAAIEFELAEASEVRLSILDVLGREVRVLAEGPRRAGPHATSFSVAGVSPGTYVVRLVAGGTAHARQMVVVR